MDLFNPKGKNVVAVGGAGGIGQAIAQGFVEAGANVLIASRSEGSLQRAVAEINEPALLEHLGAMCQEYGVKPECEVFDGGFCGNIACYLKKGVLDGEGRPGYQRPARRARHPSRHRGGPRDRDPGGDPPDPRPQGQNGPVRTEVPDGNI